MNKYLHTLVSVGFLFTVYEFDLLMFIKIAISFIFAILSQQNGVVILTKIWRHFAHLTYIKDM